MLKPFRVVTPTSVGEAAAELDRLGERAKVYAGGAELLLLMRNGLVDADYLVNIKTIPGLAEIRSDGGGLRIGAAVTHRRLETDPLVHELLPALAEAESHVGNIRVRNQGTLGGNLCFADPHADPGTALLIYDATVSVAGRGPAHSMPLGDFFVGTYEVALEPDELLTDVQVPALPAGWRAAFMRIERFYRPTCNVAVAARANDAIQDVRLAVGCIGPKAMRLSELEAKLKGLPLEEAQRAISSAKPYLTGQLEPVDDLLGSAEYKVHIASVLLRRALEQAVAGNATG
jgi:carbon-monoxide dehydrogenase medium subunit